MSYNHDTKSSTLDMGRGCAFCHCGSGEASACVREGCFKLHETDWLEGYPTAAESDIFEVRFKNTRRGYYRNTHGLSLKRGDVVVVESSPGHDVGIVSLGGDMVARQMRRTGFQPQNGEFRAIHRKAKPYDIERWQEAIGLEHDTMIRSRRIAADMKLDMKIGDVEYQGDRIKAIFYYIADGRVDFRELIKVFASEFSIKVEMKQIGARQEAGRIGGLGSCGRELCCTSWIASFNSVTTGAARTQDVSLNPQKLAGQCCKLKCCLSYELDAYIDARKSMPRVNQPLAALDGDYHLVSSDVLGGTMSFSTAKGAAVGGVVLTFDKVREIQEMNRRGAKPDSIAGIEPVRVADEEPEFVNMVGEESITRFDRSGGRRKRGRGGNDGGEGNRDGRGGNGRGGNRSGGGARPEGGPGRDGAGRVNGGEGRGNGGGEGRREGERGEGRRDGRGGNRGGNRGDRSARGGNRGGAETGGENRGERTENRGERGENRGERGGRPERRNNGGERQNGGENRAEGRNGGGEARGAGRAGAENRTERGDRGDRAERGERGERPNGGGRPNGRRGGRPPGQKTEE